MILHFGRHLLKTIGNTEEEGAVDLIHFHPFGNGQRLLVQFEIELGIVVRIEFARQHREMGRFGHAAHEEQTGHDEPHLDGHREVEQHRQHKRDEQHRHVVLRVVEQSGEGAPLAHVVTHHHEHTGQAGHGDIGRQGHGHEEDHEQHQRMHQAGHAGARPVVDVGHRACDGTRGGNAAKQRSHDVGKALSHQFLVRIVPIARHPVGHRGGEQTLNRAEYRDDQRSGQQPAEGREGETAVGRGEQAVPIELPGRDGRQRGGDGTETIADGGNLRPTLPVGQRHYGRGHHNGHQRTGQTLRNALRADDDSHRRERHREGTPTHGREVTDVAPPFVDKTGRHRAFYVQTEKIFDLRGENRERYSGGETDHNGIGNELDHAPQAEHPEQNQEEAGHHRGHQQPRKAEMLHHPVDDDDESPRRAADLHTTSAQCRDHNAGHNGRENAHTRADRVLHIATRRGGNGKSYRQREGDDAHHHTGEQISRKVGTTIGAKIAQKARTETKRLHVFDFFTYRIVRK